MKIELEKFKQFSEGIRCVMLINRNKDGGKGNRKTKTHKRITTNSEEFFKAIDELEEIKKSSDKTLRIYACVNSRNIEKAIRQFKFDLLENDYQISECKHNFYYDIKNRFFHCLMKPSSKLESNFLIDLDNCCEQGLFTVEKELSKYTEILLRYQTKNGWHIITKPFNYTKITNKQIEIKTDGLMLISW